MTTMEYGFKPSKLIGITILGGTVGLLAFGIWFYFGWMISVPSANFVQTTKKHGKNYDNATIIAPDDSFKGPQREILREGWHFRNPVMHDWSDPIPATDVAKGQVAVLTRLYGEDLPQNEYIAWKSSQKGIVPEPKTPGRHWINTYEYNVEMKPMQKIEPGYRGIVTLLSGKAPDDPFAFVVQEGDKGVQPFLLPSGTHPEYSNPYVYLVTPIDVRSHKFEFELVFLSKMGFDVQCKGTIEWAPKLDKLPELFVKYVTEDDLERSGGIDNIEQKLILPTARGYFYMVGGQYRAVNFMKGDTRAAVQTDVENSLRIFCGGEGIDIKSVVIRDARPDKRIREQYARREMATREIDKFNEEIKMQIGEVVLENAVPKVEMVEGVDENGVAIQVEKPVLDEYGRQVMEGGTPVLDDKGKEIRDGGRLAQMIEQRKKDRETQLGGVRKEIATIVRQAEEYEKVEVTKAEKVLAVATIKKEATIDTSEAIRKEGIAKANVVIMDKMAEAKGIEATVKAFADGKKYAQHELIQRFAPGITSIFSNTDDSFAAELMKKFTGTEDAKTTDE